jgi:hypothetical protein
MNLWRTFHIQAKVLILMYFLISFMISSLTYWLFKSVFLNIYTLVNIFQVFFYYHFYFIVARDCLTSIAVKTFWELFSGLLYGLS